MDDSIPGIGKRIRQRRAELDLSLSALAERAEVSKGYLWNLENHPEKVRPSGQTLYRVAAALGTSMSDLLGKELLVEVPDEITPSLQEFADEAGLSDRDVRMLAAVNFRGKQPQDKDSWAFIWRAIRASVK